MAEAGGRGGRRLIDDLLAAPHEFDFFRAVRLLELAVRRGAPPARGAEGDAPAAVEGLGRFGSPDRDPVRMRAAGSLHFPAGDVTAIEWSRDDPGAVPEASVAFSALTGPSGALPDHYTREIQRREAAKDTALADLLAIFDHRMLSLLFRAWERHRPAAAAEGRLAAGTSERPDEIVSLLLALMGLGFESLRRSLREHLGRDGTILLPHIGRLSDRRRPVGVVQAILADCFGVPVRIIQFRGRWLALGDEDRWSLGRGGDGDGSAGSLGRGTLLGHRVWDIQSCFRIRLGPLSFDQYLDFLPEGRQHEAICELTRLLVGPEFDFELQPVLRAAEIPRGRMPGRTMTEHDARRVPKLGRTGWLSSRATDTDYEGALFMANGLVQRSAPDQRPSGGADATVDAHPMDGVMDDP